MNAHKQRIRTAKKRVDTSAPKRQIIEKNGFRPNYERVREINK